MTDLPNRRERLADAFKVLKPESGGGTGRPKGDVKWFIEEYEKVTGRQPPSESTVYRWRDDKHVFQEMHMDYALLVLEEIADEELARRSKEAKAQAAAKASAKAKAQARAFRR